MLSLFNCDLNLKLFNISLMYTTSQLMVVLMEVLIRVNLFIKLANPCWLARLTSRLTLMASGCMLHVHSAVSTDQQSLQTLHFYLPGTCSPPYLTCRTCRPGSWGLMFRVNVPSWWSYSWQNATFVGPVQCAVNSPATATTGLNSTTRGHHWLTFYKQHGGSICYFQVKDVWIEGKQDREVLPLSNSCAPQKSRACQISGW